MRWSVSSGMVIDQAAPREGFFSAPGCQDRRQLVVRLPLRYLPRLSRLRARQPGREMDHGHHHLAIAVQADVHLELLVRNPIGAPALFLDQWCGRRWGPAEHQIQHREIDRTQRRSQVVGVHPAMLWLSPIQPAATATGIQLATQRSPSRDGLAGINTSGTSSYGRAVWGTKAIARRSRPSGERHRIAANKRRKPRGRMIGGISSLTSTGNAIHQSWGQEGRTRKLSATKPVTPRRAVHEGRAIQSGIALLGLTASRKPSPGIRTAATMSGVVWPPRIAKR